MTDKTIIGQTISRLRREKGMTQAELADRLHVSHQAVSQWERADTLPDILTLPALAEALSVDLEELLGAKKTAVAPPVPLIPEVSVTVSVPDPDENDTEGNYEILILRNGQAVHSFPVEPDLATSVMLAISAGDAAEIGVTCRTRRSSRNDNDAREFSVDGLNVTLNGNYNGDLSAAADVTINGNVEGDVNTAGNLIVNGEVEGDAHANGDLTVEGDLCGDAECGGSLTVEGDLCGDAMVRGNVQVDGDVCGDIRANEVHVSGDYNA